MSSFQPLVARLFRCQLIFDFIIIEEAFYRLRIHDLFTECLQLWMRIRRDTEIGAIRPIVFYTIGYLKIQMVDRCSIPHLQGKITLIRAGFADEVALPANRRGRKKKLLQVTPRGNEYLKSIGITDSRKGRGGIKHLFYQQKIKEWYESHGYTAEIEARIADDSFDVLAIARDGKRVGIEVACSSQYEEINARKALKTGVECVLFVCETKELLEKLRKKIEPLTRNGYRTKYGYKMVNDYMENE